MVGAILLMNMAMMPCMVTSSTSKGEACLVRAAFIKK